MSQLVRLTTFNTLSEALCAKAAIERLGIPCFMSGTDQNAILLTEGFGIWVPDEARETATLVLDSADGQREA